MEKEEENQLQKIAEINKVLSINKNNSLSFINEKQLKMMEESQENLKLFFQGAGISVMDIPVDTMLIDTLDQVHNNILEFHNKAVLFQERFITELKEVASKALDVCFKELSDKYNVPEDKFRVAINTLAEAGWVLPMDFAPKAILELVDKNTKEQLDKYFYSFYTQNNGDKLKKIFEELKENYHIEKWRGLIDECIKAYENGYCVIIIPSLISVIEGVLSKFLEDPKEKEIIKVCLSMLEKEDGFNAMIWDSVHNFIKRLFKSWAFNGVRRILINRHWILYGRDDTNWKPVDVVRLFIAIHTLLCVLPEPEVE